MNKMKNTYKEELDTAADFWKAVVMSAPEGYGVADPRLEYSTAATGLGETIPSDGGFVVPVQFAETLWEKVYSAGQLLDRCTRQPVTVGASLEIPAIDETSRVAGSRFGGVRTYWAEEAEAVTATKPKYRSMTLASKKLMGVGYATDELLADAPALASWLERTFAAEAAFAVEDEIVNGTGAGRLLGIVNADATITVAKESGQAAATALPANLVNMASRLWSASHGNAVWLTSNAVFNQIADAQFANGTPVATYGPNGGRFVLGMPLLLSEYTPALGSAGDVTLADFSQYLIAEKQIEFASSIHVRFLWDEQVFRFSWRIDGQSMWASPVTPKNSAVTQSPFVTLAERA